MSVPGEADGGGWDYSVEVTCKYDRDENNGRVHKRQRKEGMGMTAGDKSARPGYIYVQLLENGRVADTVVLSEANDWEYTWDELDADSQWRVVERDVPDGYTVTVEREGRVFVITIYQARRHAGTFRVPLNLRPLLMNRKSCRRRASSGGPCPCFSARG